MQPGSVRARRVGLISIVGVIGSLGLASAQTGVSDGRVSLPEGPGSLEGVGDNARVDASTGAMSYDIPIDTPEGFEAVTPALALTYSSSAGSGVVGLGWDLAVPFIERMTNRGLPRYDVDDAWVANGGEQLVRVEDGETATYRARYEKGFVRYRWHARGAGAAGYWTAESPDGPRTAGGRVLAVTGVGADLDAAVARAYAGVAAISFAGAQFRHDIGRTIPEAT